MHQLQHTPSTAYTKCSIHQVQHTPSTAYTKHCINQVQHTLSKVYTEYSIHRVQHPPMIVCLPSILMITSSPQNVGSASGVLPYTIDRHQPARHDSSTVKSPCHIPMFLSQLTDEYGLSTRHTIHRPPPSTRPISLDYDFHVYLQTHFIPAYKCISKLSRLRPASSLYHGLQVYLQTSLITVCKCVSKLTQSCPRSVSLSSLNRHFQPHLEFLSCTACSQSRYTACRWIAI